jgi:hypothetical protein
MTTTYTIRTTDEATHRAHLAGPVLLQELRDIDNDLRSLLKHDAWPPEIQTEDRTPEGLAQWLRERLSNVRIEAGVGDE